MDGAGLDDGFRVGEWLIEPRVARASRNGATVELPLEQVRLLVELARRHGEAVDRSTLRTLLFPAQPHADQKLREAVAELRRLFGDTPRQPRHIATVGADAYALVAHVERVVPPAGEAPVAVEPNVPGRVQGLLVELRRRHVFKVAASYLVGMWLMLQVAQVTFAPLRFPDWWMTALTILAVIGLPIVLVLAWTYEITPSGVVLDAGAGGSAGTVKLPRARQGIAPVVVAGVVAMACVTGFAWWRTLQTNAVEEPSAPTEPSARSIAVLPLVDMSVSAGSSSTLGDGLSEELSSRLAQVSGLRVAARTSAFEYRGRSLDVRKIGRSLGVRHVLEGSVRREGAGVRVSVQLIDARTGYHVWAGHFDRAWRDVLALQDDIARSVTEALQGVLTDRDEPRAGTASAEPSLDSRAIDAYLAGLALLRQSGDPSTLDEAIRRFEEAVQVDPSFGRAFAGLCRAGVSRYRLSRDPDDLASAERACQRALNISPQLVESEKALARLYVAGGRFGPAQAIYRRLIDRDPKGADGYVGLAEALEGEGNIADAGTNFQRATEVEPGYWGTHNALGGFLFAHGRIDEAIASYRRAVILAPSSAMARNNLGAALFMKGDVAGATQAYEQSLALEPTASAYSNVGSSYYYSGRFAKAVDAYRKATVAAPNDQTLWGNLAAAQWQVPALRTQALASYQRAIDLAEREIGVAASDPTRLAQLGYYCSRVGDLRHADEYLLQARASGSNQMYVAYYLALVAAVRGDATAMSQAKADALRLGYPKVWLELDPVLKVESAAKTGSSGTT